MITLSTPCNMVRPILIRKLHCMECKSLPCSMLHTLLWLQLHRAVQSRELWVREEVFQAYKNTPDGFLLCCIDCLEPILRVQFSQKLPCWKYMKKQNIETPKQGVCQQSVFQMSPRQSAHSFPKLSTKGLCYLLHSYCFDRICYCKQLSGHRNDHRQAGCRRYPLTSDTTSRWINNSWKQIINALIVGLVWIQNS